MDIVALATIRMKRELGLNERDLEAFRKALQTAFRSFSPAFLKGFIQQLGFKNKVDYFGRKTSKDRVLIDFYLQFVLLRNELRAYQTQNNISFLDLLAQIVSRTGFSGTTAVHDLDLFKVKLVGDPRTEQETKASLEKVRFATFVKNEAELLDLAGSGYDCVIDLEAFLRKLTSQTVAREIQDRIGQKTDIRRPVVYLEANDDVKLLSPDGSIRAWKPSDQELDPFVVFDQQHLVGTDFVLAENAIGLMVVSWANSRFSLFAQAAFRMRGLSAFQRLDLCFIDKPGARRDTFWHYLVQNEKEFMRNSELLHNVQTVKALSRRDSGYKKEMFLEPTPYHNQGELPTSLILGKSFEAKEAKLRLESVIKQNRPRGVVLAVEREQEHEEEKEKEKEKEKERVQHAGLRLPLCSTSVESVRLAYDEYFSEKIYHTKVSSVVSVQLLSAMESLKSFLSIGVLMLMAKDYSYGHAKQEFFHGTLCVFKEGFGAMLVTMAEHLALEAHKIKPDQIWTGDGESNRKGVANSALCCMLWGKGRLPVMFQLKWLQMMQNPRLLKDFQTVRQCLNAAFGFDLHSSNILIWRFLNSGDKDTKRFLKSVRENQLGDISKFVLFAFGFPMKGKFVGRNEIEELYEQALMILSKE